MSLSDFPSHSSPLPFPACSPCPPIYLPCFPDFLSSPHRPFPARPLPLAPFTTRQPCDARDARAVPAATSERPENRREFRNLTKDDYRTSNHLLGSIAGFADLLATH